MAKRYKDPNELNKRYMPKDDGMYEDDDEEYIPEEELTEEEREMIKVFENMTEETWQTLRGWAMDEEDYTLSDEEYYAKNTIAQLNTTNPNIDHDFKLAIAKLITPNDAVDIIKRLKKKPESGSNIPPDILDMIYAQAKEYKG